MDQPRNDHPILASGIAPGLWPTETFFALLWVDDKDAIEVPKQFPFSGRWGEIQSTSLSLNDEYRMPVKLDMVWLSIVEHKFYSVEADLPTAKLQEQWQEEDPVVGGPLLTHIVVGMAPYGWVALWLRGARKSSLHCWIRGDEVSVPMDQFSPTTSGATIDEYCQYYINNDAEVRENLILNGLPDAELFGRLMKQYRYRVVPLFEQWLEHEQRWERYRADADNVPQFSFVEIGCTDGTFDKTHSDFLIEHHWSGRPEQMTLAWHTGKVEWIMYVQFDPLLTAPIFERFYGAHRDTLADLLVHCDPQAKHYELALYRYGLSAPRVLPPESYQLIVFKNKYEHHRSIGYRLPSGAWIW
ncbi:MAG: DUF2931 family protein [Muribaculaceae bacterium]|nr:DUF2931 family protein [Muribaculaceae bacterium]MBR1727263.1 DUF2931 family protein [Muribaculaceae bacterium]